jgi:hypothetical protein
MSTVYDFTYTLNSETTQTELLNNANAATAKAEYAPISRFFVDETKLASIVSTNYVTDAFGPVTGSETTKYRTTSVVRAMGTAPIKVFAICAGQVLIQPQTGDTTKVNLILKPSASYSPIKIKYFIYRGVNKADLMSSNILQPIVNEGVNQPFFLRKLWKQFKDFYAGLIDPSTGEPFPAPNEFPSSLIGYDENQSQDILIENYFTRKEIDISYQIPLCSEGEHLGNFTGEIGLDIVLDYGDYQLQNQEELFKFDLKFARKKEHVFDTSTIPSSTTVKIKRYKEYIHQFMDAAAFWGSHIECGAIKTVETDASTVETVKKGLKTNNDIFTKIVNKYQTQNKIYLYIQGENNRSYNYYDATRKVFGFSPTGQLNQTGISGWPIIIEELTVAASTTPKYTKGVTFNLEYNIDTRIPEPERHIGLDIISPNNNTSKYPLLERPLNPKAPETVPAFLINKTASITTNFQVNETKSCAGFLMLYGNLKQEFPLKNYYNDLFPVNFNTNFLLPTTGTENMSSWATYDKSRMVNLDDVLDVGASIQNKLFFDNGKGPVTSGPAPRKARRLYMAVLKRNSIHNTEYDDLNIDTITSGINICNTDNYEYVKSLFNNSIDFSVYKGTFIDNGTLVDSLTLVNENSLVKKNSFFHLGITEEEYNKLVYGQTTVPVVTPPTPVPQFLPVDADNVFFHLKEDPYFTNVNIENVDKTNNYKDVEIVKNVKIVKKFEVGFSFEDATGNISTLFPTTGNEVYVYTLDGFYFFSKEYAEFQEFFEEYPKAKADFRVRQPYHGKFGFDWMRVKDTYMPDTEGGTYIGDSIDGDVIYEDYIGKLYSDTAGEIVQKDSNSILGNFVKIPKMYQKLEREYKVFPFQWKEDSTADKYYVPILTIYPPYVPPIAPSIDLDRQPIFEAPYDDDMNRIAKLVLQLSIAVEPIKVEWKYDTTLFEIIAPINIPKTITTNATSSPFHTINVDVKCLKEFDTEQLIRVVAFYDTTEKGKTIGVLRVSPNGKTSRKSKKVVLVSVKTDINGVKTPELKTKAPYLKKYLRQILITPVISTLTLDMTSSLVPSFNTNYKYNPGSGNKLIIYNKTVNGTTESGFTTLTDFLLSQKTEGKTIKDRYKDDYIMFFFDEQVIDLENGTIKGGTLTRNGFSESEKKVIVVNSIDDFTPTHEFLHLAGITHSFTAYEASKFAKFTYKPLVTDNIMDYGPIRFSLWDWQGKIARASSEREL